MSKTRNLGAIAQNAKNHSEDNSYEQRVILSAILKHGRDGFVECCDLIDDNHFDNFNDKAIYTAYQTIFNNGLPFTLPTVFQQLGLPDNKYDDIKASLSYDCDDRSVIRPFAQTLRKKGLIKDGISAHRECIQSLSHFEGIESISEILGVSEKALFNLVAKITKGADSTPINLGSVAKEMVDEWAANPVQNLGLPMPWPKVNASIGGGLRTGVHLFGARLKALRHGSKVYTKNGPINIEDIKVGDIIKHPFKGDVKVTEVHPHTNKDIYRVYFRDGDFVDCCEDHLWHVEKRYKCKKKSQSVLKTTKELIGDLKSGKQKYKWDIPLPSPVEFKENEIPIDPYVLGVLLGDGSVSNNTCVYHTADDEIHQYMLNYANSIGCEVKIDSDRPDNKVISYRINTFQNKLRESGIWGHNCYTKFIPKNYIYNSKEVRLAVLAGLLDTDGTCVIDSRSKQSRTRFNSVSKQLCLDVKEIVQSLGGLCSITNIKSKCNGKTFHSFGCEVRLPVGINPFRLKRKAERFTERVIGQLKRTIVKIEKVGVDNATCLTLSDNDGLFMTDNYVVTHNTGKTSLSIMTAASIAPMGIPVLMLDTEMKTKAIMPKVLANLSEVKITEIENGTFARNELTKKRVYSAVAQMSNVKIAHMSIAGYKFDEVISTIRRWIYTDVGLRADGTANPCLICYDYFKVMDSGELANAREDQVLGFNISKLVDFANKFDFPCLSFAQLNRDGITREDSGAVGASDRLAQYANSLTIFKRKTEEEMQIDGPEGGNRKMITTDSRYGGEAETSDQHIHMQMEKDYCILKEVNFVRKQDRKL